MVADAYIQMQNQTHKKRCVEQGFVYVKNAISLIIKRLCCIYIILRIENLNVIPNKVRNALLKTVTRWEEVTQNRYVFWQREFE